MKKAIIAGASGMVGSLILKNCLASDKVEKVISLVRRKSGQSHPKLEEVINKNFSDYSKQSNLFQNIDMAFFCIGVYTGEVPDDKFKMITIDFAVAFAEALKVNSPNATLCMLSGAGADRTEKSRTAFARYKGMAENQITALGLGAFYTFRPAYIYPVTPRDEPNLMYRFTRMIYPLIRLMGQNASIKSTELAGGMFQAGLNGAPSEILENSDIIKLSNKVIKP